MILNDAARPDYCVIHSNRYVKIYIECPFLIEAIAELKQDHNEKTRNVNFKLTFGMPKEEEDSKKKGKSSKKKEDDEEKDDKSESENEADDDETGYSKIYKDFQVAEENNKIVKRTLFFGQTMFTVRIDTLNGLEYTYNKYLDVKKKTPARNLRYSDGVLRVRFYKIYQK